MAPLQITPVHPVLGARVEGVDLTAAVDDATFRKIHDAFQEYSVLIFPGQRLTDAQQMAFTTRFGPLETTIKSIGQERRLHENMVDLSNVDPKAEERLMGWNDRRMLYQSGNQLWHTDRSFKPVPAMASLLSGREVPPTGGETEYVSMRHAHATLPAGLHRGRPWDAGRYRRVMRRTTLAGEGPTADPPYATRTPAWDGIIPEGVGV